jgi:hypothetical protein
LNPERYGMSAEAGESTPPVSHFRAFARPDRLPAEALQRAVSEAGDGGFRGWSWDDDEHAGAVVARADAAIAGVARRRRAHAGTELAAALDEAAKATRGMSARRAGARGRCSRSACCLRSGARRRHC